jgi:hypothetical protein
MHRRAVALQQVHLRFAAAVSGWHARAERLLASGVGELPEGEGLLKEVQAFMWGGEECELARWV